MLWASHRSYPQKMQQQQQQRDDEDITLIFKKKIYNDFCGDDDLIE